MQQIHTYTEVMEEIERRRNAQSLSMRQLSTQAGAGHGSYWAALQDDREPYLTTVLAYLDVVGLALYMGPKK